MTGNGPIIPADGILTKDWPVVIKNYWFNQRPREGDHLDIARLHSVTAPVEGAVNKESWTLMLPLDRPEAEIMAKIESDTRRQIRRAEREGVKVEWLEPTNPGVLDAFAVFYQRFAASKGEVAGTLQASLRLEILRQKAACGMLDVNRAVNHTDGGVLAYQLNIVACGRARNHLCASLYREKTEQSKYLGRAYRYLQWRNIIAYRDRGFDLYDFGGWYEKKDNPSLLKVNEFKEAFGGNLVREFDALVGISPRGRLFLPLQATYRRLQEGMNRLVSWGPR